MKAMTWTTALAAGALSAALVAVSTPSAQEAAPAPDAAQQPPAMMMEMDHAARFAAADADGDGALSPDEIAAYAESMRGDRAAARAARMAQGMLDRFDANGDGLLQEAEIPQPGAPMGLAFGQFDTDGNGMISPEEFDARLAVMRSRMEERRAARMQDGRGREARGGRHDGMRGDGPMGAGGGMGDGGAGMGRPVPPQAD